MINDQGKSDGPVVPAKSPNNVAPATAEVVEERGPAKENTNGQNASRTQSRSSRQLPDAPSALDRVRRAARQSRARASRPKERFTALFHHVTEDRLRAAFFATSRRAAPGVDRITWQQYRADIDRRISDLHARLHRGAYRASPSRRVFIPKADGGERPLAIASLEDKIVQRAVAEVLCAVYEEDFLGFSYGFRAGRSQHDALDALAVGIFRNKINWVLDCDIRGFFDAMSHEWLQRFIEHRIGDGRILRLIQKWLKAGIMEDGKRTRPQVGSPQGATISPLLANVYLHYVFDLWAHAWRRRNAGGDMIMIRYADDIIVGFQLKSDASRFRFELTQRMQKFGLELHPEKTRMLQFGKLVPQYRKRDGKGRAETFDFLGFTHICGTSRGGKFLLLRRTIKKRMRASLKTIRSELMRRRHRSIPEQGTWVKSILRGHYAYFAVPGNICRVAAFRDQIVRHWLHALRRRSHKHNMTWDRMHQLAQTWAPSPRILHPWPEQRFDAKIRGRSPVR